jgi:hypothetical protein
MEIRCSSLPLIVSDINAKLFTVISRATFFSKLGLFVAESILEDL